ncbi:MAG TPA: alcohol dehydrogenase catalytic domain-containing protein [Streptosporangiaceae bacterium]|nr:alcohol dehydrogenase catalytic domain-containing protein [Streptosporangiaceae bacterium]
MKAARLVSLRKPLELVDLPDPAPDPGEVVVEVEAEGICRTDWHVWNGDWGWVGLTPTLPLVMGHELGGTVVAVGAGVSAVRIGERVTTPFHESCGRCRYCLLGRSNLCDDLQFLGLTHDGGYARYAVIRNADFNCIRLPDAVDSLAAAAIGCRYMTAFHAVTKQGRLAAGQWVVVHGAGGIGLSAVQIAHALGGRVIAVDLTDAKLEKATTEGALHTINAARTDVVDAVNELTGGGADLAIGGIGAAALVESAVLSLRKGGRLVQIGLTSQAEQGYVQVPLDHIIEGEIEIVGSVGNPHVDYPGLLGLVEIGVLQPARIVGETLPLEKVNDVLTAMDTYETLGFSVITGF